MPRQADPVQLYGITKRGKRVAANISDEGALDFFIQDQHTKALFIPMHTHTGNVFTLTSAANPGHWTINVSAGHGLVGGEPIACGCVDNWFYGYVVGVAGNVITLDRVINVRYPAGHPFEELTEDMAVDGSGARVVYHAYSVPDLDFDITAMHISIICATEPDDSMFGDLAALTRGISLRRRDGLTGEYFNMGTARTNGHMSLFVGNGNLVYTDKAGGGAFAVRVSANFRGSWGVTARLRGSTAGPYAPNGRDEMHMVIQDDIDGLDSMHILLIGHVVE